MKHTAPRQLVPSSGHSALAERQRDTLAKLRSQLADQHADRSPTLVISTGVSEIDRTLPHEGLQRGCVHEWFAQSPSTTTHPPVLLLAALAAQALKQAEQPTRAIWIGRCVWPQGWMLERTLLERCLFLDVQTHADRLWAIDQTARSGIAGVVIADGSGIGLAESRRLQIAAEQGSTLALLARPSDEQEELSAAHTRWRLTSAPSDSGCPRWNLQLLRCKGARLLDPDEAQNAWTLELTPAAELPSGGIDHGSCHVRLASDVGDRSRLSTGCTDRVIQSQFG